MKLLKKSQYWRWRRIIMADCEALVACNTTEIAHSHRIAFYPILKTENEYCYFFGQRKYTIF